MGEKYVLLNGKQVKLDPKNPELRKQLGSKVLDAITKVDAPVQLTPASLGFGAVIEYNAQGATSVGKITGYDQTSKKYIVSVAISKSRAGGFLFSSDDTTKVSFKDVTRKL